MENPADDAVIQRWQQVERERQQSNNGASSRKRPRQAIENEAVSDQQFAITTAVSSSANRAARKVTGARSKRAQEREPEDGRIYELLSDE